jgi:hypothetical protein
VEEVRLLSLNLAVAVDEEDDDEGGDVVAHE